MHSCGRASGLFIHVQSRLVCWWSQSLQQITLISLLIPKTEHIQSEHQPNSLSVQHVHIRGIEKDTLFCHSFNFPVPHSFHHFKTKAALDRLYSAFHDLQFHRQIFLQGTYPSISYFLRRNQSYIPHLLIPFGNSFMYNCCISSRSTLSDKHLLLHSNQKLSDHLHRYTILTITFCITVHNTLW
jgi:hypothetical protein